MAVRTVPEYIRKAYKDFSGGLNTQLSATTVPPNQFIQLDNALINDRGLLEKSKGYTLDGSPFPDATTDFIRMLHNYKRGTTVDKLIVAASDNTNSNATYKVDIKETAGDGSYDYIGYTTGTATFTNGSATVSGSGTAWTTHLKVGDKIKPNATSAWYEISAIGSATSLTISSNFAEATQAGANYKARIILHKDFIPVAVTFNNNLIISNGSETMITYNNTTATLITDADAPKGKFLEPHKQRLFSAGTSSGPSSIFWSAVNDETSWDASSVEVIFANDNGNISAIKSFANSLLVFKDNGNIYQVVGDFDQTAVGDIAFVRKVDTPENIGVIAGRSAVVGNDNKCYFLAETGIYTIDARMGVTKISYAIDPTIASLLLKSTLTTNKSYVYDSKTQWDAGTHSGTVAGTEGTLRQFCDQYTSISNAKQDHNLASVAIDSNNIVHVAYSATTGSSTTEAVKYARFDTDGTVTLEEHPTLTTQYSVSVAANANKVGILSATNSDGSTNRVWFSERISSGTATFTAGSTAVTGSGTSWSTQVTANSKIKNASDSTWYTVQTVNSDTSITLSAAFSDTAGSAQNYVIWTAVETAASNVPSSNAAPRCVAVKYNSSGDPRGAFVTSTGALVSVKKSSGTWSNVQVLTGASVASATNAYRVSIAVNSSDIYISCGFEQNEARAWKSTNDGTSFANTENHSITAMAESDLVQVSYNSSNQGLSGYSTGGALSVRNHAAGSTASLDSTANGQCSGFTHYSGQHYALNVVGASGSQAEKYIFEGSSTVTSSTTNLYSKTYRVAQGMDNNAATFATAAFGTSSNSIVVRRVAFRAVWTSNERSDSTLTAWGTYELGGETTSGNTITREVALNTASPATAYVTITSGSVISTDATKIYVIARLTSVLTTLSSGASWESLTMSYTGAGVDAKMPTGYVFNNEYYLAVCESGNDANNKTLLVDRDLAFMLQSYPVTCFARYKKRLYAGAATTGKVFKLLEGYNANSSAYTFTAITKEDLLGSVELQKEIYKVYVLYEVKSAGTFTFSYRTDNFTSPSGASWIDTTVTQTTAADIPGYQEISVRTAPLRSIQFKVVNSTADNEVSIIGFVIMFHYLNVR